MYIVSYSWPTAGPNGLDFFKETHGYPGGNVDRIWSLKFDFKRSTGNGGHSS